MVYHINNSESSFYSIETAYIGFKAVRCGQLNLLSRNESIVSITLLNMIELLDAKL